MELQLKRAIAINKALKKEKAELHKLGRSQDLRKKEATPTSTELKLAKETPNPLFLQPLQPDLSIRTHLDDTERNDKSQNSIAIPQIHSLEGNGSSMEYSVSTMMRDTITEISLYYVC